MSIQDFHAQLTTTHQPDALLATLRRLSMVENLKAMIQDPVNPMGEWGIWAAATAQ